MRFTFRLISTLCVLFFASSAYAATLVASTSCFLCSPGSTVTITLVGTTQPYSPDGIAPFDATQSIDVRIVGAGFTLVSAETGTGGTCVATLGCIAGAAYSVGGTQGATIGGNFQAFSQIGGLVAGPLTNNMTPGVPFATGTSSLTAVFTMIAPFAPGIVNIEMSEIGAGFFGITGPRVLASFGIPEPTTAALMGLGLLGLAATARKR